MTAVRNTTINYLYEATSAEKNVVCEREYGQLLEIMKKGYFLPS